MKRITKLATGTFAGAALALPPIALPGTANAAPANATPANARPANTPDAGNRAVITFEPSGGASSSADDKVIRCRIEAKRPRHSGYSDTGRPNLVTASGTVKCDHRVARIAIRVGLYKNGELYKQSEVRSNTHEYAIAQNASRWCVPQKNYTGVTIAKVFAPRGYRPRHANGTAVSRSTYLTTCQPDT